MTVNKKFLQLTGALLIIIFHLWIKLSSSFVESFLVSIAYIGVDIFFLVSVTSLVNREINYREFIINRFRSIYPKFIAFILIMALFNMSVKNMFNRLFFIEFFSKGGGAFLWFIPAILIFYLIFPLFIKWNNKYKTVYGFIIYLLLSIVCTLTKQNQLMIVIQRIPLILIAYELCTRKINNQKLTGSILLIIGILLLYKYGYSPKLNKPFYNLFYVMAIPSVTGISMIIPKFKLPKILELISNSTLEIYAFQMIFGFKLASIIYKFVDVAFISNLLTISIIVFISVLFNLFWKKYITSLTSM